VNFLLFPRSIPANYLQQLLRRSGPCRVSIACRLRSQCWCGLSVGAATYELCCLFSTALCRHVAARRVGVARRARDRLQAMCARHCTSMAAPGPAKLTSLLAGRLTLWILRRWRQRAGYTELRKALVVVVPMIRTIATSGAALRSMRRMP
jgi:hypothetical protein